ncbi:MAG: transporter substrate-binding domain-containing protein [Sneathiella sp.]
MFSPRNQSLAGLLLAVLFILISQTPAFANEKKPLRFCYGNWEPFIFENDQGQVEGVAVDLITIALTGTEYEAVYESMPYKRCSDEVMRGRKDVVMFLSPGSLDVLESKSVFAYWSVAAIVHKNDPLSRFSASADLNGKSLLVIDGYAYPGVLGQWIKTSNQVIAVNYGKEKDEDYLRPFRMLEAGRAHVFFEDSYWGRELIKDNQLDLKVLMPSIVVEANRLGFTYGLEEVREMIDDNLSRLSAAERDQIFHKHSGQSEADFSTSFTEN